MKENNSIIILSAIVTLMFLTFFPVNAQKDIVHGKVTLYQEIAVVNTIVINKKTKKSVQSDSLGFFSIECNLKDKLSISATGLDKKTIKIKSLKDSIKIDLIVSGKESDIQLAADNGHIYLTDVAFVTKKYNTKPPYSLGYTNIIQLMANKFPQISFVDNMFVMRGINSISSDASGNTSIQGNGALIVINGILSDIGTLKSIALADIKNIEILTGSAAAKYGPGGGNGVISVKLYSK